MSIFQSLWNALLDISVVIIDLYTWVVIIGAVLSWLIAFSVVNRGNRLVSTVSDLCFRLTEPVLAPIRRKVPTIGGLDLSPVVLILGLLFIKYFLFYVKAGQA